MTTLPPDIEAAIDAYGRAARDAGLFGDASAIRATADAARAALAAAAAARCPTDEEWAAIRRLIATGDAAASLSGAILRGEGTPETWREYDRRCYEQDAALAAPALAAVRRKGETLEEPARA